MKDQANALQPAPLRILFVEDAAADVELCLRELRRSGLAVECDVAVQPKEFLAFLHERAYDIIVADYHLPGWTGLDALDMLRREGNTIPLILLSGSLGEETAVECVKQGVADYILKDRLARLPVAVRRAVEEQDLRQTQARTDQALQAKEAQFRVLFASNPHPMWVYDRVTLRFLEVNDAAVHLYGYSRDEFLDMTILDIRPQEDVPRVLEQIRRSEPPGPPAGQWRHRLKDGSIRDVEIHSHSIEFGTRPAVLVVTQDITDRIRARQALAASEERYRRLFETAKDGILILDEETGVITDANPYLIELLGYRREDLLGKQLWEIGLFRDIVASQEAFRTLQTRGYIRYDNLPLRHKEGMRREVEFVSNAYPVGAKWVMQCNVRDITARRQAEEALRESEARYREFVEHAHHGIYTSTQDGRFLYVNPALVRMLGYESEHQVLQLNVDRDVYCQPADRELLVAKFLDSGHIEGEHAEWRRKDGKSILVRLSGRALTPVGNEQRAFEVIAEDITDQRALEIQLRQAQKFEAIGQLAGGVAHDFNNVLGAVLGWADLALQEVSPGNKLHGYLQRIQQQAERAAELTRQLLAFGRRQILEPRNVDINEIITETIRLLDKVIGKDVELKLGLTPDLQPARADPTQVEQVLMNLCLNSRDAMPRGGQLVIETRDVEMDQEYCRQHVHAKPGQYVLLSVTDNGTGMDAATVERIFEPFFTTKAMGKGSGLGLAVVYGIVKQHGGFVHVYSESGHGTVFHVYWPAAQGVAERKQARPVAPARGGTETLLVAEDHEGMREMARTTLERLGYRVLLADNGEDAVQLFRQNQQDIALVVLDIVMPKMGGPDAYQHMHKLRSDLPVIFATGYSAEAPMIRSLSEKSTPILQKPYAPDVLARAVREALDQVPHR